MVIVNGSKRFEDVNELLEEIKNTKHIHPDHNELNYIRQLMERASQFDHNNATHAMQYHTQETRKPDNSRSSTAMHDMITAIHVGDPYGLMSHVLSYINEEEYDTDSFLDDFTKNDDETPWPQATEYVKWEKIKQMEDISFIGIEDVMTFIHNGQYEKCDLDGKEFYVFGQQYSFLNWPYSWSGRQLIDHVNSEEAKQEPVYRVYDLDGVFGNDSSRTIRERCYDEWKRDTTNVIKEMWQSFCTSTPYILESNLLRIKLSHSNGDIDETRNGLSFNLLRDIYNVHKCFLFANYHSIHYGTAQFANDIQNCKHFNSSTRQHIDSIAGDTIDLYPSYIIDDDMYAIGKYFFSATHTQD
eukprot:126718_1